MAEKTEGLRLDKGKLRYDLEHPIAREGLIRVLTKGSFKYSEKNWEFGMPWSKVIAPAKRHLAAIEKGEDYDIDLNCSDCQKSTKENWICKNHTGELHADLLQCNAHFLSAYYKIAPQFDDRRHTYLTYPKIGLDIDEVLCDFTKGWAKLHGTDERPTSWFYHRKMGEEFKKMKADGTLDDFYLSLEPKIKATDIPFEPHAYVTSRPCSSEVTEKWLELHKFPGTKAITVGVGESKVEVIKAAGIEVFVDDGFHNFSELNKNGICCYLLDAPHNQRYSVGHKRIYSLKELV